MKRTISLMLVIMLFLSFSIYCSAETTNTKLNTPIKSSLLFECLFEDEALDSIEQIDPIEKTDISTITDYSHIGSEVIRLGNGEGVTVIIETTPADISLDDFMFHFDESLLDVTAKDIINDPTKNKTILHIVIHAKKPCYTPFEIYETYQLFDENLNTEDIYYTELQINGMSAADGRVVYVTPTGEKYHFSSDCAGENYITTTMADVLAYEYEPCHKCAS